MVNAVIAKIEAQQVGLDENSPAYHVGEQLKDICRSCPEQADLLFNDLDNPEMSIANAEKKIKAFADEIHKRTKDHVGFPDKVADKILREFYGLAGAAEPPKVQQNKPEGIIDLADFM